MPKFRASSVLVEATTFEARQHAGDLRRVMEGGRVGQAQADVAGDARHDRQQHGWV
jgi:hypothetical protein